jgi:hypothetical protein
VDEDDQFVGESELRKVTGTLRPGYLANEKYSSADRVKISNKPDKNRMGHNQSGFICAESWTMRNNKIENNVTAEWVVETFGEFRWNGTWHGCRIRFRRVGGV